MSESETVFNTYTYTGPIQSVALKAPGADGEPVVFFEDTLYPGRDYLLPEGHKVVEGWKALNLIEVKGA